MKKSRRFNLSWVITLSLALVACSQQAQTTATVANTSSITTTVSTTVPTNTTTSTVNPGANSDTTNAVIVATNTAIPTLATTVAATSTPTQPPTPTVTKEATPSAIPTDPYLSGSPAAAHATMVAGGSLSEVLRGRPGKKEIAITLDAGSTAVAFTKELEALDKYHVKVTFFMTGMWVRENPQYAQEIAKDGQEIANHTFDHPDLTKVSDDKVIQEITQGANIIESVTGVVPKPLFRFPYGSYNGHTMKLLNNLGYRSIYWTYDSLDSVGKPKTSQEIYKIVTSISDAKLDGAIILMHLGNLTSGEALGPIIENLQGRGFKIVTISELLQ